MKKIAVIGAGRWGKNLARNLFELEALHTICDTNEYLLDDYESKYPDVKLTTNFQHVLSDEEVAAVVIASPAALHYRLAKEALESGKDLFVEKPLCLKEQEAVELAEMAESTGRILMCGHLLHYHPCVEKLKEMVRQGALGEIVYISAHRLDCGPVRCEENALWNFAPHDLSVILSLTDGEIPEKVRCTGRDFITTDIHDNSLIFLDFPSGLKAHIFASWLHPFNEQKLVVVGSSGMAVFDDTLSWEEKLTVANIAISRSAGNIPCLEKADTEQVLVPHQEPLRAECEHFLNCLSTRERPLTDGWEAVKVIQVLEACERSLAAGGKAQAPLGGTDPEGGELVPIYLPKK